MQRHVDVLVMQSIWKYRKDLRELRQDGLADVSCHFSYQLFRDICLWKLQVSLFLSGTPYTSIFNQLRNRPLDF